MSNADFYAGKTVWIVGATSGIGRELALLLASRGAVVIASGRTMNALEELEHIAEGRIQSLQIDISDPQSIKNALSTLGGEKLPDCMIYMAAFYEPTCIDEISAEDLEKTIRINLWGAIELIRQLAPTFYERGSGQIAITASVAGYSGLPNGQPYSATKAALINFTESLYIEAKKKGVDIKLINPGFVATPMTDKNEFEMPDILTAEAAAKHIAEGLMRSKFEIHFPKKFTRKLKFLKQLCYPLYFRIANKL